MIIKRNTKIIIEEKKKACLKKVIKKKDNIITSVMFNSSVSILMSKNLKQAGFLKPINLNIKSKGLIFYYKKNDKLIIVNNFLFNFLFLMLELINF